MSWAIDGGSQERVVRARLLAQLTPLGVVGSYTNAAGEIIDVPTATLALAAKNFDPSAAAAEPLVCTPGHFHPRIFGTLQCEDGHEVLVNGTVDQPGYHVLHDEEGVRHLVICTPPNLRTPKRGWGWQVQLYAARTSQSWGIGDFRDLATLCRLASDQGADCVQVSPVHAVAPVSNPQDSPYSPASRHFLNLLHVAPGEAPGAERVDLCELSARGRQLNDQRLIHRGQVWQLKKQALEKIWWANRHESNAELRSYCARRGNSLRTFAVWCSIAEAMDTADWRSWPAELHRPDSPAVQRFTREHIDRVLFYTWCQWVAEQQYARACSSGVEVIADLAVGFDFDSEEAWAYQDSLSFDFEIGCPPDIHNPEGQHWGLPPFQPQRLASSDFAPFIAMVRQALRHATALRVDHAMQMWRLFWVPVHGEPAQGTYVNYPVDALLAILRLEASRANAWIVGEDMGTVPSGVRRSMRDIGMLANRSASRVSPAEFPVLCVGTSATHDQATLAGLLTGFDSEQLRRVGKEADWGEVEHSRRVLDDLSGIDPHKPPHELTSDELGRAVLRRHQRLADSPSLVVLASLDDAALVRARPNIPGTVGDYPNWCIALPEPVDEIMAGSLAGEFAATLNARR
ncbi:4-alpha-glucanotransferase [Propionibacterium cyclohexanicum]|uniref:4-alpha-glucanotransferase n=2 Tax=Propionibacterium cyclohexanicum TaxID=64702 RepID=A0A1H9SGM9_9ACTN|nr:4-alpha-glucanotransferase [Propionibacterium cyclohexanicum]